MCRLYAFLANEPTKVECSLVHAQNALLHQSRANSCGRAHPDGWGIVCYRDGSTQAERRATAAHEDLWFSMTAERTFSRAVIAHVRKATVGEAKLENTHPFTHGCWTFAHNGTLAAFARIRPVLERETDPDLLRHRIGTTDSEQPWVLHSQNECSNSQSPDSEPARAVTGRRMVCHPKGHEDWSELPNQAIITANSEGHVAVYHITQQHNRSSAGGTLSLRVP